jgi:hypothetical protein
MRSSLTATAALVLVWMLGGCGGGDNAPAARTATTAPTTAATTTTAAPAARRSRIDRVSGCLTNLGYMLTGGAPQVGDRDAPDYEIILHSPRGGAFIGFYKNESRAKRLATQLRSSAKRTRGAAVERHGTINIVWVDLAGSAARDGVRACLVT